MNKKKEMKPEELQMAAVEHELGRYQKALSSLEVDEWTDVAALRTRAEAAEGDREFLRKHVLLMDTELKAADETTAKAVELLRIWRWCWVNQCDGRIRWPFRQTDAFLASQEKKP